MNKKWFVFWLVFFWLGLILLFFVPESPNSIFTPTLRFFSLGFWATILTLLTFKLAKTVQENTPESAMSENVLDDSITGMQEPNTNIFNEIPGNKEPEKEECVPESLPENLPDSVILPEKPLENFIKTILKNRPFAEPVASLKHLLQEMFQGSSGILYMYNGKQSEMSSVFSYGDALLGKDVIAPSECASFNKGDIVVTEFEKESLSDGCTHLENKKTGVAFCVPIEGLEEHFGFLTVYATKLSENEIQSWKLRLRLVSALFGLFVADQNLNIRYEEHNIRDTLTDLFNKKYLEESLVREISAAKRHRTPIGMLMVYPDAVTDIETKYGKKTKEQLLWEIGQRLPKYIRTEDIPCRYAGEIFCIILPGADIAITNSRAERIRQEIEALEISFGDIILKTTLSIGVSVLPQFARSGEELIQNSLLALDKAVQTGTNKVVSSSDTKHT